MTDDRAAAHFQVMQMLDMYRAAAVAVAAVRSGILDLLTSGPLSIEDICETLNYMPSVTSRFIRNLTALNFLKMEDDLVALDDKGAALTVDSPFRLREQALLIEMEYAQAWFGLHYALNEGNAAYIETHGGENVWEHRAQNEEEGAAFTRFMHRNAPSVIRALESFPFEDFDGVIDFGGGDGTILGGLLDRHLHLNGTLVEAPHVAAAAKPRDRLRIQAGDIFDHDSNAALSVLGTNLGMLCHVLHDWHLTMAITLLDSTIKALGPDPYILVVERTITEPRTPVDAMRDLHMMAVTGGQERTRQEFEDLFEMAGLEICKEGEMWMLLHKIKEAP